MAVRFSSFLGPLLLVLLASACGATSAATPPPDTGAGSDAGIDGAIDEPAPDGGHDALLDVRFEHQIVMRATPVSPSTTLLLLERPLAIRTEWGLPQREVRWVDASGGTTHAFAAPAGHELVDMALHPSGEVSVLLATPDGYVLVRLDSEGVLLGRTLVGDDAIASDPPKLEPWESTGPIERVTHDAARIAALGEDVVLGGRTGRHSVVAYRASFRASSYEIVWRTLVEPGLEILPIGLTGGTYDTFGQLEGQHSVRIGVDAKSRVYLAVRHPEGYGLDFAALHEKVFGEALATDADGMDLFVTRLDANGTRLGTSVVGTPELDEIFGFRVFDDDAYVVGRKEYPDEQGYGWDALVGRVDGATGEVSVREFDVDRGDVLFDVAKAEDGGLVVVGASGYWQNPHGASISEECHTFMRWLGPDGRDVTLPLPDGPRHSEARGIVSLPDGRFLVTGMVDGPGTHSADADPSLLRANGFLVERRLR